MRSEPLSPPLMAPAAYPPRSAVNLSRTAIYLAIYLALMLLAVGIFFWVRHFGEGSGPTPLPFPKTASPASDMLLHVLLALGVVMLAARAVGVVFKRIGQPPVIGEVMAGLLLGPSFLGRLWPNAAA